jgi:uncharacterized SAM-binding protein YcdF (DUF218 family)
MFKRLFAFIALAWVLGFAAFALWLPQPAPMTAIDGVVVLTGGPGRIPRGLAVMEQVKARRMLISGVDRDVKPDELSAQYKGNEEMLVCCVDLGFAAVDTRSNAEETAQWVKQNQMRSVRLVTDDWHMRRARLELNQVLPASVIVVNDAVPSKASLMSLFKEYNKYWVRAVTALFGI